MRNFIAVASLFSLAAISSANLIANGDFESEVYASQHQVVTSVTGWNLIGRNVAITHNPYFSAPNIECDLSGTVDTTPGTSGLEQTIATTIGRRYYLSFTVFAGTQFAGGNTGGVDLYIGGFVPGNLVLSDLEGNRSTVNYSFLATSASTTVSFISHEGNVSHIDNVSLSTPAPAAVVAFAASALRIRRRRK